MWTSLTCLVVAFPVGSPLAGDGRISIDLGSGHFADFHYGERVRVPYLWPLIGPGGVEMTRAFPMETGRAGESTDHPHHTSVWFAHGDVNGHDFWHGGEGGARIATTGEASVTLTGGAVIAKTTHRWLAAGGGALLREERAMCFDELEGARTIDFEIRLEALVDVTFGDTKEGTFAVRTHPALRLKGPVAMGHAVSSEGLEDGDLWGRRARWVDYSGVIDGTEVGLALFDHPDNPRHPTWWHARDYGLVAANPFGIGAFEGRPSGTGDLVLSKGDVVVLRYRIVLHPGAADRVALERDLERSWTAWVDDTRTWVPPGWSLVLDETFDSASSLERFWFTDPAFYRHEREADAGWLELTDGGAYTPPHRSPHRIALVRELAVGDFALEAEVLQTGRDYGHRDLCFFFGFTAPDRFYYTHLASAPDENAHNVFLVDRAARRNVAPVNTSGVDWGREVWRRVRITRTGDEVRVWFGDDEAPTLRATDDTLGVGHVGFGLDDTGRIRRLRVWAPRELSPVLTANPFRGH